MSRYSSVKNPTSLSPREEQVKELIIKGMRTDDIAVQLNISPRTVKYHLATVYKLFGVSSRFELIVKVLNGN